MNNEPAVKISDATVGPAGLKKLPLLVKAVIILTVLACISGAALEELKPAALAWLLPLVIALVVVLQRFGAIKFPYAIWLPWAIMISAYYILSDADNALQRSIMLLCPLVVGCAASTYVVSDETLMSFRRACGQMAAIFVIGVLLKTGILLTGALPGATGLASEVMTCSLLCCFFAANYAFGRQRDLLWWSALAIIPVIAVTRMGIIAAGVSLPFTFAPLTFAKRFAFIAAIFIAGIFVFNTERIQQKTFYTGSGTIQDVRLENPDFATSGRTFMWDALEYEIGKEPWFGHGANADEVFLFKLFAKYTQPHNDWLRLTYNYGYVGVILFGITLLFQTAHAWSRGRKSTGDTRVLFYVGASSFLIFSLFMLSDNIIYYAAFFGNLQFTILGMAYASYAGSGSQAIATQKDTNPKKG
jgi:hypothetical protein